MTDKVPKTLRSIITVCGIVAAVGAVVCAAIAFNHWEQLCRPLLLGYLSCWLIAMGTTGILALGNLTGGHWAAATRPYYLAAVNTLPILALLFVLIAFNLDHIYPWTPVHTTMRESLPASKAEYLSPNFFFARAVGYYLLWFLVWLMLSRVSRFDVPPASTPGMRRAGALSLVIVIPTTTFAAFDWAMSLEPHWYSSIYGALLSAGGIVAGTALAIIGLASTVKGTQVVILPGNDDHFEEVPVRGIFNDVGNLLLTFIMLSTYFAFSQFLIIWSGDLPEEISWYTRRLAGGWCVLALAVAIFFFAVPFLMLLSREGKRRASYLATVAAIVLVAYVANMVWTIIPAFDALDARSVALAVCGLITIGSSWLAFYFYHLGRLLSAIQEPFDTSVN